MKYMVEIDGEVSTRYTYNVYSIDTFGVDEKDGRGKIDEFYMKDTRIFCSDDVNEFLEFMKTLKK